MQMTDYRTFGRSGLIVSPLALGTMTFGAGRWGTDEPTARALFDTYVEAGGNLIDTADVYNGPRLSEAPDIQVGFNYGYGNSDASSTGRVPNKVLEDNLGGTFNGNHLMAAEVVKGTLLTNAPVAEGAHSLQDLTVEILRQYGITPRVDQTGHPVLR